MDDRKADRPNFLFIITDQQRADWIGCYGHPLIKTPHIDAIAARGVRFDNFHATSPICMPNRATLMTGRYPSMHGLRYNGCSLSHRANTFVDVLRAAGYNTAAIGKSHLQPFLDRPPILARPVRERLIEEAWRSSGEDWGHEEPGRYVTDEDYVFPTPYYGFEHVDMVTGHGDHCGGHYQQWVRRHVPDWQFLQDPVNQLPHDYICPQAFRTPMPVEAHSSRYVADRTARYLADRQGDDQPFFAFVSFPDPHHPFTPPGDYWGLYSPEQFEVPLPFAAHRNPPPPLSWMKQHFESGGVGATAATSVYASDQQIREAMALTAGMIALVDDSIGRVMAALEASGHADNTIVCFTTDHGDYLGDFNLLFKGALPFRSITRVPFLWSDPRDRAPRSSAAMASTIDIPATILDRVDLEPYNGFQGESLLPVINSGGDHRQDLYIEYTDIGPRLGFETAARVRAVVNERWRYTYYKNEDWGELYDLEKDPFETHNRWDDPGYRDARFELSERLNYHLSCMMDESPAANRLS